MPLKLGFSVTAKNLLSPSGKTLINQATDAPKIVGVGVPGGSFIVLSSPGPNGTTDSLINTGDGFTILAARDFTAFLLDVSMTNSQGS